jgi:hypothetical protein
MWISLLNILYNVIQRGCEAKSLRLGFVINEELELRM